MIDETQGWIALRFKVGFNTAGNDIGIWGWGPSSNSALILYYRALQPGWDVRRENAGASLQLLVTDTVATNDLVTLVMAWTATEIKLSVDGGTFSTQGNTEIPVLSENLFSIGGAPNMSARINSDVYWVAGGTGTLTDGDAATIHGFGNTDPTPSGLPGTPTFVWPASSNHFKTSDSIAYVSKALTPTSATETGAAQVLDITAGGGGAINVNITPATETDAAVALVATKTIFKTVTEATETDAAQALSVTKPIVKAVTAATETDAAQAVTFTKTIVKSVTAATEIDTAQVLSITKTILKSITAATEVDEAQILSFVKPIYKTLTETTETDSAEILDFTFGGGGGPIEVTLTPATETSTAEALTLFKSLAVTAVTETDAAQALIGYKSVVITPSTETDESVGLTVYKPLSITPVSETDAAQALTLYKSLTLTAASEADSALALAITKTIYKTLTLAGETDAAIALSFTGGEAPVVRRTVGPIIIGRF
jgi:hypothetical protein